MDICIIFMQYFQIYFSNTLLFPWKYPCMVDFPSSHVDSRTAAPLLGISNSYLDVHPSWGPSYGMSYPTQKWDDWDVPHLKTAITFVIIIITINICMIYIDVLLSLLLRDIASRKTMVVTMMVVIL